MANKTVKANLILMNADTEGGGFDLSVKASDTMDRQTIYDVSSDLPSSKMFEIFEEIVTKIIQARHLANEYINLLVTDYNHIVRDTSFPIPSMVSSHLEIARQAANSLDDALDGIETVILPKHERRSPKTAKRRSRPKEGDADTA